MKQPCWRPYVSPQSSNSEDRAPAVLASLAASMRSGESRALAGRARIEFDEPVRAVRVAAEELANAWHADGADGVDVWCAIEAQAAAALLYLILRGPGSRTPTPLERGIVRESVERVLAAGDRHWEERDPSIAPQGPIWSCDLRLRGESGTTATLSLFAAAQEPPLRAAPRRIDLRDVPVMLHASIPEFRLCVGDVAAWRPGTIVHICAGEETPVILRAGTKPVAAAALGIARERRALRITSLVQDAVA